MRKDVLVHLGRGMKNYEKLLSLINDLYEGVKKIQSILSEDLEEAINKLQEFFVEQPAQLQEFILIKGKFNQISKDRRIGVISI